MPPELQQPPHARPDPLALERFRVLSQLYAARQSAEQVASGVAGLMDHPLTFIDDCVHFQPGGGLTSYQREIIADIPVHKRVAVRGPHGLGKCVGIGEYMRKADGSLTIARDLIGKRFAVLARNDRGEVVPVGAWATDNGTEPVVRITTDKGREIIRTLNHPLWGDLDPKSHPAPEGRGRMRPDPGWVPAGELRPGSVIATYLGNEGAAVSADPDEVVILGCLLTEGGLTSPGQVKFSQADGPLLDDFRRAVAALGGRVVPAGAQIDYRVTGCVRGKEPRRSNPVLALVRSWGIAGCSSYTMAMPPEVWTWDDKSLGLLLNRMFSGDGWAHSGPRPGTRTNREAGYCSVSYQLAQDVQRALLRLGIQAELRPRKTTWVHKGIRKHGHAYTVAVHDIAGILAFCDRVGILGKESQVEALRESCAAASAKEQQRWRWHNLGERFAWERVRTVEHLGPQPTVAITVPGPQTFITDFLEHNTALVSLVILWFALTREAASRDWKVVATAGGWRQLEHYLWPEIRKWAKRLDWEKLDRPPLDERSELMRLNLKLRHGEAFAAASDKPELIEGAHADSILYIFDESKAIIADTFDAAEGAFSGAEASEGLEAFALAVSTPGEPAGRFYEIHRHAPGLEDWHTRHVTLGEAIEARRVSPKWAQQRARQWGTTTAVYNNRVLGEFWSSDEDALVPLAWAEQAQERYQAWLDAGRPAQGAPHTIGVDVARSGQDKTVLAVRTGDVITEIRVTVKEDTMATAGRVKGLLQADPDATAIVDVIGIGAGVVDRLREQKMKVEGFNASAGTKRKDATNELGMSNLRTAAWWNLRELLDPSRSAKLALPPDDELLGDLTSLHWKAMSGGKIQVESKDDVRKRIGRSTDKGDAVMQAMWASGVSWLDAYNVMMCTKCERGFVRRGKDACPHCKTLISDMEDVA